MPNTAPTSRPGKEVQSERLLESALLLFSRRGTEAVSVAEICAHANLSRDTFYRCFSDKNDLVAQMYTSNMELHIERAQSLITKKDLGIGGLKELISEGIDYILEMGPMALALMIDARTLDSAARQIVDHGKSVINDTIKNWAEETYSVTPQAELVSICMSSIEQIMQQLLETKNPGNEDIEKAKELAWKTVCGVFLVEACSNNKLSLATMNDDSGGAITSSIDLIARTLNEKH